MDKGICITIKVTLVGAGIYIYNNTESIYPVVLFFTQGASNLLGISDPKK